MFRSLLELSFKLFLFFSFLHVFLVGFKALEGSWVVVEVKRTGFKYPN